MTTKDVLIELIKTAHGNRFTIRPELVDFVNVMPDFAGNHNTRVTVVSKPGSGYKGQAHVYYHRFTFNDASVPAKLMSEVAVNKDQLLTMLNARTTIPMTWDDLQPVAMPSSMAPGDIYTLDLATKPESMVWMGIGKVSLLCGLPDNSDEVYDIMNSVMPKVWS